MKSILRLKLIGLLILLSNLLIAQNNDRRAGVITMKLSEKKCQSLETKGMWRSATGNIQMGDKSFDDLLTRSKATRLKRIFPYAGKFEAKHRKHGLHQWYELSFDPSLDVVAVSKEYGNHQDVSEVSYIYDAVLFDEIRTSEQSLDVPPNDPQYEDQWGYNNTGQTGGTANIDINLEDAWSLETGSSNIVVAIIDTGVDPDHEDLAANMWVNSGEIAGNGIDDDNNGYIDDINGYHFAEDRGDVSSFTLDHGSHVAGTVAAVNNNGTGVAGVAGGDGTQGGVKLMSCGIFTEQGISNNIPAAFVYAADNGAVIAQNSWGSSTTGFFSPLQRAGIDYFVDEAGYDENGNPSGPMQGGLVIFAAGNDNLDSERYPAYYPRVMAVGAVDHNNDPASFTNYGDWVDIAAPGVDILSTYRNNGYGLLSGTSMACPHVSGVAALIASRFQGNITPAEIRERIENTATASNYNIPLGAGLLNAFDAINLDASTLNFPKLEVIYDQVDETLTYGDSHTDNLTIRNVGNLPVDYTLTPLEGIDFVDVEGQEVERFYQNFETLQTGMLAEDIPDWHDFRDLTTTGDWMVSNIDPYSGSNHLYVNTANFSSDNQFSNSSVIYTAPFFPPTDQGYYGMSLKIKFSRPMDFQIGLNGIDWFRDSSSGYLDFKEDGTVVTENATGTDLMTIPATEFPIGEYYDIKLIVENNEDSHMRIYVNDELIAIGAAPFNQEVGSMRLLVDETKTIQGEIFIDDIKFFTGLQQEVIWFDDSGVISGTLLPGEEIQYPFTINALPELTANRRYETGIDLESTAVSHEEARYRVYMTIEDVPITNLAPDGIASQSSTLFNAVAGRAIDRDTNGEWVGGSITHTSNEANPFWQVALAETSDIEEIVLFNRIDNCCEERLTNFTVSILNNGTTIFSQSYNQTVNGSLSIDVPNVIGDVVKVQLDETNVLSLAEVEVYGVEIADECVDNLIQQNNLDIIQDYSANFTIETNGKVLAGYDVEYNAGQSVEMTEGFEVELSGIYHVYIQSCSN